MPRRPLLFAAAGYSAAVFISYHSGTKTALIMAAVFFALALFMQNREPAATKNSYLILCIAFIVGAAAFACESLKSDPLYEQAAEEAGTYCEVECIVKKIESKENAEGEKYFRIRAKAKRLNGSKINGCGVMITSYSESCKAVPGDRIAVCGELDIPSARRNPGCFDYRRYLRTLGIRTIMTASDIAVISSGSLEGWLYKYRVFFLERLSEQAGEDTAAMMDGILFGNKSEIDEETIESFKRNGTMHILAVSGLHVGILYVFLLKLWSIVGTLTGGVICGRRGIAFLLFTGSFFWMYMILASFSPSVVRAVFMVLLHVIAQMRGKRYDINSAAFAVYLAVLLLNPYMLFNTGFEMSFLAVISIALIIPYINKVYQGIMGASIAVQIGLGPFILYNFNCISILTIFINIPVVLAAGLIVPIGVCQVVLINLFGDNAMAVSKALEALCDMLTIINEKASVDGITTFTVASPDMRLLFAYYLLITLMATEEGRLRIMRTAREKRPQYILKLILAAVIASASFGYIADDGFTKTGITFVDVGQGDCMCIRCDPGPLQRHGPVYLIDGGGSASYNVGIKVLREYLLKNGMTHVDGAFVSHLHTDHYQGICELAKAGMVDHLYVYEGYRLRENEICEETGLCAKDITYLHAGQELTLYKRRKYDDSVTLTVLWPERKSGSDYNRLLQDETNENDLSLLLKLNYKGITMLATGDMDENGESAVISRLSGNKDKLKSNILKVGHHGSKTSTSELFVNYVNPTISVIQVGKNIYGHPTPEAIGRLEAAGSTIYRNDTQGAVGVVIRNHRIKGIATMIKKYENVSTRY